MAFKILDIGQIPDELLATDPFLQSVLGLLKYSRTRDFEDKLEFILRCLLEIGTVELQTEHLDAVLVYITTVSPSIPMETLAMTIQKIFPTQIELGSIADEYMKKGRQEGKQEGKQEGLKEGQIQLIQTLQEILGLPLSDASTFQDRSLDQLQAITAELRQQVRERN
jgi:hypothetical protein